MIKRIAQWSKREYSLPQRLLASLAAGVLFAFLLPFTLYRLVPRLDAVLGLPALAFGAGNLIIGGVLVAVGLFYAFWSIGDQLFTAKGTPLPVMATQKLLVSGPFRQCRNPMAFGTMAAYLGISVFAGSILSILVVLILSGLLIWYIKRVEERELAERFGQAYLDYKQSTPFLIPRPGRGRG